MNIIQVILIIPLAIKRNLNTCLKIITALSIFFAPMFLDTKVPPPMANIEASPNNITVKGSTIFTDANAKSPTP